MSDTEGPKVDEMNITKLINADVLPLIITYTASAIAADPDHDITNVQNILTQKNFTIEEATKLATKAAKDLEKNFEKNFDDSAYTESEFSDESLTGTLPLFKMTGNKLTDAQKKAKFQKMVRSYLRSKHPSQQIVLLNKIQAKTPFTILNPEQLLSQQGIRYGYADLLRFMCDPVKTGEVAKRLNTGKNPFYQPIRYTVPDEEGNAILEKLHLQNTKNIKEKLEEIKYLQKELKSGSKEKKAKTLGTLISVIKELQDIRNDPITMSKHIKGQERPMSEYRKKHFFSLLRQLNTRKKMHPASSGINAPDSTGISLTGKSKKTKSKRGKKSKK